MQQHPANSEETSELLKKVEGGDRASLDRLIQQHRAALCRFVDQRLDNRIRGRVDASDIVQDALVEAVRRIDQFLSLRPMPFSLWLRKTTYERLLDQYRFHFGADRRSVERELLLSDNSSLTMAEALATNVPTPSTLAGNKELVEVVRQALSELEPSDREIVLMRSLEQLSYDEISQLLEIGVDAARKRHGRALLRLHSVLKRHGLGKSDL